MTRGRTITEADIVAFSGLTGDHHPQHTDAVWAEAGPFGGILAHGMLVLSYAVGLVPLDPERVVALRRFEEVVFKRPVRIGDTIHVEVKLVRPDEGRGLEAWEWRILNQDDELVIRAKVEAVVRGEADPEAESEPAEDEGTVSR
ncbi:MAG: MaoC family dehydratase [Actinomycetota bacterium]|nr:MaoC family dehydratase [Actinomycetota bacterium]